MAERLALCILPGMRWSAQEIQTVAREAEEAGFDAIFTNEFGNDALATAQLMGAATHRILVGTYIVNIYLRHPYVCAQGAALLADATGGRFVLGLGVSHQQVNEALGIDMQHPPTALRRYATAVQSWLRGESPLTSLPQRAAAHPVPVYVAALASHAVDSGASWPMASCPSCGPRRASRRARRGPPAAAPKPLGGARWPSRSAYRPCSATTWRRSTPRHARALASTQLFPTCSGCSG